MIAEYVYDNTETLAKIRSYVHGSQYVDERAVMRDHLQDPVEDDTVGQDHYYLLKDLYTVAGVVGRNGGVEEYYVYDPYGEATLYQWQIYDLNHDGNVNILDRQTVYLDLFATDEPMLDVTLDGNVNALDLAAVQNAYYTPIPEVTYSSVGNPYLFTGRTTDTLEADDLLVSNDTDGFRRYQDNRNRTYDPKHGRWLQRDWIGIRPSQFGGVMPIQQYLDGMNLYQYVGSRPVVLLDPTGGCTDSKDYGLDEGIPECKELWNNFLNNRKSCHGPFWKMGLCCDLIDGVCKLKGTPCPDDVKTCRNVDPNDEKANPCHAGGHLDPVCWMLAGAKGDMCKDKWPNNEKVKWKWMQNHMYMFKLCDHSTVSKCLTTAHKKGGPPGQYFPRFCGDPSNPLNCETACGSYCENKDYVLPKDKQACLEQCKEQCAKQPF